MDRILVVMAAGLGSRYGGVKQIERLGPGGEILMEYAIFDALKAGFNRVVLILKPDIFDDVKELFGDRIERGSGIKLEYAMQENEKFTQSKPSLGSRSKPLGTVHAVLCAKELLNAPFVVVNADDYYGPEAFRNICDVLTELTGAGDSAMVAYKLKNTVSDFGTVTRGVCRVEDSHLRKVKETYKIKLMDDGRICDCSDSEDGAELDPECYVSMNMWAYHPEVIPVMEEYFECFLNKLGDTDQKSECLLPTMMDELIASGKIKTRVLHTGGRWFGLTYKEDKPIAVDALRTLHESKFYPPTLWGQNINTD